MYIENYVAGFVCVGQECHVEIEKAGMSSRPLEIGNSEYVKPLSFSQEMLMLCYYSGQVPESAWYQHLEEDPILKAHFTLRQSLNSNPQQGKSG